MPIELPPLRDRGNDLLILSKHFVKEFCGENKLAIKVLSAEAMNKLRAYSFPGNIRELRNVVERLVIMSDKSITEDDITRYVN